MYQRTTMSIGDLNRAIERLPAMNPVIRGKKTTYHLASSSVVYMTATTLDTMPGFVSVVHPEGLFRVSFTIVE